MASKVPTVKLNNGKQIPILGLGTWKSKSGEVTQVVKDAIDIGYRHFDCAHVYENEKEVGEGIAAKINEGIVKREDLFVTSKLWNTYHRPAVVEGALMTTLKNLRLKYLDLYLIHWPMGYQEGESLFPVDEKGKIQYSDVDYVDTWKAMELIVEKDLVRSIGVSNFNQNQINRILSVCKLPPVTNQIECHPYLIQKDLTKFCKSKNIAITAYSPLGSPDRPWAKPDEPVLLEDKKLQELATKHNKTPAQIVLRYQIEKGHITIPKTVSKSRLQENFDVFNFQLQPEDINFIDGFDCNGRICPSDSDVSHPHYPF